MEDFDDELNRAIGVVERAEALLHWAQTLSGIYQRGLDNASDKRDFMLQGPMMLAVIQINLFFGDSLLCANSSLFGDAKEDKEEIGFPYIKKKYPEELKSANPSFDVCLSRAIKTFENNHLKTVRNKHIAHKDLLTSGDAIMGFMNRFNNILIDELREVISTLKAIVAGFDVPQNNGFMMFYEPAFETFKKSLKDGIHKYQMSFE